MEGFTLIDGIVALIVVVSAILAYSRGFVRECMSIAGWVIAAILGYQLAPKAVPLIKELPVLGTYIADSCELSVITSFFGVFAIALVIVSLFTPLVSSWLRDSAVGKVDQGLGLVFGVLRGIILIAIALVVVDRFTAGDPIPAIENARSLQIFDNTQSRLNDNLPTDAPSWITERYEALVSTCTQ